METTIKQKVYSHLINFAFDRLIEDIDTYIIHGGLYVEIKGRFTAKEENSDTGYYWTDETFEGVYSVYEDGDLIENENIKMLL